MYPTSRETSAICYPQSASIKGEFWRKRKIEASDSIPFVATWNVSNLPADLTRCRMQFDGVSCYEIMMTSSELVGFLIDVIPNFKRARIIDFSKGFYRKLLHMND